MSIGGIDLVLRGPAQECVGDLILRACRGHWSGSTCYFQDADDEHNVYPLDNPWVWTQGTACKEFFVYRDKQAVDSWSEEGARRENVNTMFHFIIGDSDLNDPRMVEVAFVCDRLTKEVRAFVCNLQDTFLAGAAVVGPREAA